MVILDLLFVKMDSLVRNMYNKIDYDKDWKEKLAIMQIVILYDFLYLNEQ